MTKLVFLKFASICKEGILTLSNFAWYTAAGNSLASSSMVSSPRMVSLAEGHSTSSYVIASIHWFSGCNALGVGCLTNGFQAPSRFVERVGICLKSRHSLPCQYLHDGWSRVRVGSTLVLLKLWPRLVLGEKLCLPPVKLWQNGTTRWSASQHFPILDGIWCRRVMSKRDRFGMLVVHECDMFWGKGTNNGKSSIILTYGHTLGGGNRDLKSSRLHPTVSPIGFTTSWT